MMKFNVQWSIRRAVNVGNDQSVDAFPVETGRFDGQASFFNLSLESFYSVVE